MKLVVFCLLAAVAVGHPHNAIEQDLHQAEMAVEESSMSSMEKSQKMATIKSIGHNVRRLQHASGAEKYQLEERIDQEIQHLRATDEPESASFEEDQAKISKVDRDIRQLEEALTSSNLGVHERKEAMKNLESIKADTTRLLAAPASQKSFLKKAMKLRVKAFQAQIGEGSSFEEDRAVRVEEDVQQLEEALTSSNLGPLERKEAMKNLEAIKVDATRLLTAATSQKRSLKQAMALRVKAFRAQIGEESSFEEDKAVRVEDDVQQLEEALASSNLPVHQRKEAMKNLEAIKADATRLLAAPTSHLKEAMKLRVKAFRAQIGEELFEEDKTSKIEQDVKQLEEEIAHSTLSQIQRKEAKKNLNALLEDAERIASTQSAQAKKTLAHAAQLRLEALKEDIGDEPAEEVTENSQTNIDDAVGDLEEAISSSHLTASKKQAARHSLNAIKSDMSSLKSNGNKLHLSQLVHHHLSQLMQEISPDAGSFEESLETPDYLEIDSSLPKLRL